jgi:DNA (cytosine-5)-methyltransferase 1
VRIGSLFSGYGGLDMAVSSVLGGEVAWHVEYDKAPSRILAHHYPTVPNYGDVTAVDFTTIEPVDVLTGGYPCQPFSHAGLRKGTNDDRHLWPHVLRAIREMGPRLAILENVRGHISLGFDVVLADLADLGWSARWGVVRASDAGAPHQRARLFIVAYPDRGRRKQRDQGERRLPVLDAGGSGLAAHSRRKRHGRGQDSGMVGRLGAAAEVVGRQASPPRAVLGDRGYEDAADASNGEQQEHPRHDGIDGEWTAVGRGSVLAAWAGGGGVDLVGSLARPHAADRGTATSDLAVNWGDYGPAIARWERVIGRQAPAPTEPGRTGNPRLAPRFVEWMMGLPDGHVTDPAIGISRNDQLKALGNGVVPQQAALALDVLLKGTPYDIRQGLATV